MNTIDSLSRNSNVVVLTGAGISVESGIRSFRGADGLWEAHRLEDVATPEAFARQPELVQRFYNERRRQLLNSEIAPNAAHCALACWEQAWDGNFLLVTQNIDNLHERAGSKSLIHMHGELLKSRCAHCEHIDEIHDDLDIDAVCLRCRELGTLRPHVVWFGEEPLALDTIYDALEAADLFVSIGTSGNVYPAAGFVMVARGNGRCRTIEINIDDSEVSMHFDEKRAGPATQTVDEFVSQLLDSES